jgi:hypothetical protein
MDEANVTSLFEIRISPAQLTPWSEWLCHLFCYRHMYARIAVGFIADIDKPVGRIPAFAFPLLGVPDGGRVICEVAMREKKGKHYVVRQLPIRVFCLSPEIQAEREKKEGTGRFRSSEKLLGIDNELPKVFVGHNVRHLLKSGDLDVVRLRRSIPYVLTLESVNFGVAAVAALVTIATPVFLFTENLVARVVSLVVACVVMAALMAYRVRSSIK